MLAWIGEQWEPWGLGAVPNRLRSLLLTRGPRTISKTVALIFAEPDPMPRVVVKRPRVPEADGGLRREAAALAAVQALGPGGVPGVPRLLFSGEHAAGLTVIETALTGQPLFSLLRAETYRALALQATDWLVELGERGPARPASGGRSVVEQALETFTRQFGSLVDPVLLRESEQLLGSLGSLAHVVEQRDFSPWNVHVGPAGDLVVFDWESAELDGVPMLDLVYFLTYLAFFHDGALGRGRTRQSYRRSLDPSTFTGQVQREATGRYAARLGFDPALARALRALTWMIHCRSDYLHLAADAAAAPDPAALGKSLFLGLWEEELRT